MSQEEREVNLLRAVGQAFTDYMHPCCEKCNSRIITCECEQKDKSSVRSVVCPEKKKVWFFQEQSQKYRNLGWNACHDAFMKVLKEIGICK